MKTTKEAEVAVELKPTLVELVKKAMNKPNATPKQIAKYLEILLKEEMQLQEQIEKNKKKQVEVKYNW